MNAGNLLGRVKPALAPYTLQESSLAFVLAHDVSEGVGELGREKLTPLLKLKYHDAISDLGRPEEIGHLFAGFQKYLYQAAP